jgi:hypothetical protein
MSVYKNQPFISRKGRNDKAQKPQKTDIQNVNLRTLRLNFAIFA